MRKKSGFRKGLLLIAALILLTIAAFFAAKQVFPQDYKAEVTAAADRHGLQSDFVFAVIWTESKFNPSAVSKVGAKGLMQLMPDTYEWLCSLRRDDTGDLFDPAVNIEYGCYNLSLLLERYDFEWVAIAAYNAGRTRVDGWLADGIDKNSIPFEETRRFVLQVQAVKILYSFLY